MPLLALSPARLLELQRSYVERVNALWREFLTEPQKLSESLSDPRFADEAWRQNTLAALYARAYLLNAEFMNKLADSVEADRKTKRRIKFAVQHWIEAAAPSNFLALNPRAQKRLLETKGESLAAGLANLLKDLARGRISQTDESAFEVGRNVATTEGGVVYENALMQLLQYAPRTEKVYRRPLVIVPPCINKYYILDLQPDNSFIRYCVEQGHTVFVVSWKNPHEPEARMTWDDYLELGPIAAFRVAREITGAEKVNALGFCVGGTIVATALAVLYARGEDPIASLTLLTALLDFEDTGVLDVFVDEAHVRMREQTIGKGGLMPGLELANTFSSLRPNDLVWNYVVNNYLEGRQPPPFDLLYWNGDSTNLPGPMYCWYLRNTYLENNLRVPGKLVCCGQPVDLNRIRVPAYVFAAREDHIVPWKAAYASARLLPGSGPGSVKFVLGASGHIAGTVNPPSKNRRSYWVAPPQAGLPADSEAWLHAATERPGSWWPDFAAWLAPFGDGEVPARRQLGSAKYPVIEPAPGRYVKEKA
ncbi:MAG: class I poly(R)-hydroxyalkanoic acid synthase [Sutterellaceae bacterium]|nr:class I poly(R)-hydroxyalkanoic acid synthase [Burkholderiaceae bacterium]MCX7902177.1 class I poly(R)-hydroxyalkanoic acid synthase [Burkholderiaceae bacterium]MDW8430418.1 class I poly(R)-hydroxyalkanoic acid synthase [Sutterellaceae bacterium]